jgi:putative ABC transport system permease protein
MKIPLSYNYRSLAGRPMSTAFTALGIGLVVAVFIAMLALANGFAAALTTTGSDRNVLVLRKGADNEMSSSITREIASIIAATPYVAKGADGAPLTSPEVYVVIPLGRGGDTTKLANVVLRGVSERVWDVRANLSLVGGVRPSAGQNEVCIGQKLVGRFAGTEVGGTMNFAGRAWKVACVFSAGGSSFESEIWGMNEQVMPVMRGEVFQSLTFRLTDPAAFPEAERLLEADERLQVDAHQEATFYANQSKMLGTMLKILAGLITSIMAVGAVFGAINTMFAAVAARRSEIAVLLTLGFKPSSILMSFLVESMFLALAGGIIGCLIALPTNGMVASTINWATFSDIAFAFRVTPGLLASGLIFSLVMGLVGGFFPALRAARLQVVQAIR